MTEASFRQSLASFVSGDRFVVDHPEPLLFDNRAVSQVCRVSGKAPEFEIAADGVGWCQD